MATEASHKVKVISFKGRRVPIMLQDANGPCPLLAIANVLLLRNQLQLPPRVGEVSQARLVEMVAGRLVDSSSQAQGRPGVSDEHAASLAQNLADAIGLLPQLCTGVDVNPRLHDIRGFEFTRETAVFDLLDVELVHGWLVDPQDGATAAAVGARSYNELVVQLVTALGSAATPGQLTPAGSVRAGGGSLTPSGSGAAAAAAAAAAEDGAAAQGSGAAGQEQQQQQQQRIDAGMLSAALRDALHVSAPAPGGEGAAGEAAAPAPAPPADASRVSSTQSMPTSDSMHSMHSMVNRMLTDLVSETFTATPTSRPAGTGPPAGGEPAAHAPPSPFDSPADSPADAAQRQARLPLTPHASAASLDLGDPQQRGAQPPPRRGGSPLTPHASAALPDEMAVQQGAAAAQAGAAAAAAGGAPPPPGAGSPGEDAVRRALLVQQFLEGSPSQLTYAGLLALHEGLRDGQLAVLFRNNHFNTLFKGPGGQLFILATDEGFQFESDVVWEALGEVDGDTQLVGADFRPFRPHASQQDARQRQSEAQEADWAAAAAAAAAGGGSHDADLALAMQLQAEEEERVRAEGEARRQQAARQAEEARRAGGAQPTTLPSQRRPSSGEAGAAGGKKKKEKKPGSDCCIQ